MKIIRFACIMFLLVGGLLLSPTSLTSSSPSVALSDSGFSTDALYSQLSINLIVGNSVQDRVDIAELIYDELDNIGINVSLTSAGWDVIGPRTFSYQANESGIPSYDNGGHDIFLMTFNAPDQPKSLELHSEDNLTPQGFNTAWYQNSTVTNLIDQYNLTTDPVKKFEIAQQIQAMTYHDLPYIPIIQETQGNYTTFLSVNMNHPVLGTGEETPVGFRDSSQATEAARALRKGLAHLIPFDTINETVKNGLGFHSPTIWHPNSTDYDASLPIHEYDVDKAKEYFAAAGYDGIDDFNPNDFNDSDGDNETNGMDDSEDTDPVSLDFPMSSGLILGFLLMILIPIVKSRSKL